MHTAVETESIHPAHRRRPQGHTLAWWALAAVVFVLLSLVGV